MAVLASVLFLPLALFGPNTLEACFACVVLGAGICLLWRPGEPPILLLIFLYQWIQASAGAFYSNVRGLSLDEAAIYHGNGSLAVLLMLTGLLTLALAFRFAAGARVPDLSKRIGALVSRRPMRFWVWVYVVSWIFSTTCSLIAPHSGGFSQPLLTLSSSKWAAFVLLTMAAFGAPGRSKAAWWIAFAVEFVLSIGGFFSSFKDVFIYAICGLAACNVRLRPRIIIPGVILAIVMIFLGIVWTAVKNEYRSLANAGTAEQVVLLGQTERLQELGKLAFSIDAEKLQDATDRMVQRLAYHEVFGVVLNVVPANTPHTRGGIWGEALLRTVMPRALFPNKRAINDSEITNQYTGLGVSSVEQGTSISMGYMAEAYIDFGAVGMFAPIALLGAFIGMFYKWLLSRRSFDGVVGAALAPFTLMWALAAETSILKMIPALGLAMLATIIVLKALAPMLLPPTTRLAARRRAALR